MVVIGGGREDLHVCFGRLMCQPLEALPLAPGPAGQLLERGLRALDLLFVRGVLDQVAGELQRSLLKCDGAVYGGLVRVLDLLEDLLKLLLRYLGDPLSGPLYKGYYVPWRGRRHGHD